MMLSSDTARYATTWARVLDTMNSVQDEKVGVLPLMADFTTGTFTTKDIAADLNMTPQALNKALAQKGLIVRYGDKGAFCLGKNFICLIFNKLSMRFCQGKIFCTCFAKAICLSKIIKVLIISVL